MPRRHVDLLLAWLDAVRRQDADALRAMLVDDAVWQGVRPEWACHGADEIAATFLERGRCVDDLDEVALFGDGDRAVLHLRAPCLRALDERFHPRGIYLAFIQDADGRIVRIEDHDRRGGALPVDAEAPAPGVPEAPVRDGVAQGPGWFVVNAADAPWVTGRFGAYTAFQGIEAFEQIGVNIGVLEPGQPACWYHREADQEDFLVLRGQVLLLVEGQERRLRQWDFVHCPPWTDHVFVGAGDGPSSLLAIGGRSAAGVVYPVAEVALRHGAGVRTATNKPAEAYAGTPEDVPVDFDPSWLPG